MGHSTQLHLGNTLDSQSRNIYECFIFDQNDEGFCIVTGKTSECQELIKKKDLIITAVNVMPEVKDLLLTVVHSVIKVVNAETKTFECKNCLKRGVADGSNNFIEHMNYCIYGKAATLLKKLEGIT